MESAVPLLILVEIPSSATVSQDGPREAGIRLMAERKRSLIVPAIYLFLVICDGPGSE
jgi:hypothetical protein